MKDPYKKIISLIGGMAFALLLAEGLLRVLSVNSGFMAARELTQFRQNPDLVDKFAIDPELGFMPNLGTNPQYTKFGTITNAYSLMKTNHADRLLFIGDSVTARGKIVSALRDMYGDRDFEYWNAGVESFNTVQEVNYYLKFNHAISPNHVILTFHMNDFEATPVTFKSGKKLIVYAPNMPTTSINPVLFRYSMIYRLILGRTIDLHKEIESVKADTEASLVRLHNELSAKNITFSVIVFSYLKPLSEWTAEDKLTYYEIMEILTRNEIRTFDITPVTQNSLMRGNRIQEEAGDDWHPNETISTAIAEHLKANRLL